MTHYQRFICSSWLVLSFTATGCMHTRYAESNSLMTGPSHDCPCGAHNATYKERRWSGFWLRQPVEVQP